MESKIETDGKVPYTCTSSTVSEGTHLHQTPPIPLTGSAEMAHTRRARPGFNLQRALRVGTWNIMNLSDDHRLSCLSGKLRRLRVGIVWLSEVRRPGNEVGSSGVWGDSSNFSPLSYFSSLVSLFFPTFSQSFPFSIRTHSRISISYHQVRTQASH